MSGERLERSVVRGTPETSTIRNNPTRTGLIVVPDKEVWEVEINVYSRIVSIKGPDRICLLWRKEYKVK